MKMKYEAVPSYETVEIVGKTIDTVTGTIDRKPVSRVLLTTDAGFTGAHHVVGGDNTVIRSVQKIGTENGEAATVELFVRLVGDIKSLASYKFFEGFVAKNAENPEVTDLYTTDGCQINKIINTAKRMCDDHPECDSQWEIVDGSGKRYFLRTIATSLTGNGMVD